MGDIIKHKYMSTLKRAFFVNSVTKIIFKMVQMHNSDAESSGILATYQKLLNCEYQGIYFTLEGQ